LSFAEWFAIFISPIMRYLLIEPKKT
jgi:hypothetical protein